MAWKALSADDIFISYSRKDANVYAVGLANELTQKGFSCFFDRLGTEANANLPASLIQKIKGCTMFVLIGTEGAAGSQFVEQEINSFTEANGTSRIVPVDFDGHLSRARWYSKVVGIAPEVESSETLNSGDPSSAVVNRIDKSFNYTRSKARLRKYTIGAGFTLAILTLASVAAAFIARQQFAQAIESRSEAQLAKAEAINAKNDAKKAREDALSAQDTAKKAQDEATRQGESARRATLEVAQQQKLAKAATMEAQKQQRFAEVAKREADKQQKLAEEQSARNRRLSYAGDIKQAQQAFEAGNIQQGRLLLQAQLPKPDREDLRAYEWHYLSRLYQSDLATLPETSVAIKCLAFSPDGQTLVTNGDNNLVKLWDVNLARGKGNGWNVAGSSVFAVLPGHTNQITSVSFSPDGQLLATTDSDYHLKIWDMTSRREVDLPPDLSGDGADLAAFSPDGKTLALKMMQGALELWNINPAKEITKRGRLTGGVMSMAFSPNSKYLVTSHGNSISVWDVDSQKEITHLKGIKDYTLALAFSPDGKMMATGGRDAAVKIWDTVFWQELATLPGHREYVYSVAFSPDGKTLASGGNDLMVKLWDVGSRRELITFKGHEGAINSVAFSPDGTIVASASDDKSVKFWNASTRNDDDALKGHEQLITSGAFSPDGKLFATGSYDATVRLWDTKTKKQLAVFSPPQRAILALSFSPDGKLLATGSEDSTVKLHAIPSGRVIMTFRRDQQHSTSWVKTVAFSPTDGNLLVSGYDDGTLIFWDVALQKRIFSLKGRGDWATAVAFSHNGKTLAIGGRGESITLLDIASKTRWLLLATGNVRCLTFSLDGKMLASGDWDGTVTLWDTKGNELATLRGHLAAITALAFSPDSRTLATGSMDNTARLWSLSSYLELVTLKKHTGALRAVAFSPDTNLLVTAGEDGTVRLW